MLSRQSLRISLALGMAALALAACDVSQNAVQSTPGGGTAIQIGPGMNCFENKCFRYDAARGLINVNGRERINPPAGVSLASGSITPDQFRATFQRGMSARTIGGNER